MRFKADVKVALKQGVLDPQGSVVESAVRAMGYAGVDHVRIGKYIEVWVESESEEQAAALVRELGKKILINPVLETFTFTLALAADQTAAAGVK